jgi:hypothetical protein
MLAKWLTEDYDLGLTPSSPVEAHPRFGGKYFFLLQSAAISQGSK